MNTFMVRWLKLSLVAIVGCGFLAMVVYALMNSDEIRSTQIEPPLITPPTEALKRRPDQPGGMQLPNRDKLVFDLLDSDGTPITPTTDIAQTGMLPEATANAEPADGGSDMVVVTSSTAPTPAPTPSAEAVKPIEAPSVPETPKVEVKPESVKPVEAPKIEIKPAASSVKSGWGVQLAAVGSKADGDKAAATMAKTYAALKPLTPHVVATPDGKHYRVQFSGLKSRDEAAAVCGKLAGKPCFPVAIQ